MNHEAGGQDEQLILERALSAWRRSRHWQVHSRAHAAQEAFEGHVQGDRQLISLGNGFGQVYLAQEKAYLRGPMFQSAVLGPRVDIRRLAAVTVNLWVTCDREFYESRGHDHTAFAMFAKQFLLRPGVAAASTRSHDGGSSIVFSVDGSPIVVDVPVAGDPEIIALGYFSQEINADLSYQIDESVFPEIDSRETIGLPDVIRLLKNPSKKVSKKRTLRKSDIEGGPVVDSRSLVRLDLAAINSPIECAYDAELQVIEYLITSAPELLRHLDFDSHDMTLSVYADSQEAAGQLRDCIKTLFAAPELLS